MVHPQDEFFAKLLDTLAVAVCIFDDCDRTLHWNSTFLRFFPEHAADIHVGEPYRRNLRRFYEGRLQGEERAHLERYIEEGVARHRNQTRPFGFLHNGRHLQVSSQLSPAGHRVRIWRTLTSEAAESEVAPGTSSFPIDMLDHIADGAIILDARDRIVAANAEFRSLYDVPVTVSVIGSTLEDVVAQAWAAAGFPDRAQAASIHNSLRYAGAPFEVELPGGRWCRVIARRSADGAGYFIHSDISALKRQHRELQLAEAKAREGERALQRLHDELATMATTDALTGLSNRRGFDARLTDEWLGAMRNGTGLSLMLLDIDQFKSVNDRFGHQVGDECLRMIAGVIRGCVRQGTDLASRYGGEEFYIALPKSGEFAAIDVAHRIRERVAGTDWRALHPELAKVTVSIGLCIVAGTESTLSMSEALRVADAMLYMAKRNGRDRVEIVRAAEIRAGHFLDIPTAKAG